MTKLKDLLAEYPTTMYREPTDKCLHTGDIVRLDLSDFKKILRYEAMEKVLEQYLNDPNYKTGLWAVLNQPCDMVHDPDKKRQMKGSLFLAPLQGLRAALRKGIPAGDVIHNTSLASAENVVVEPYKKFLEGQAWNEYPRPDHEPQKDYYKRINAEIVAPSITGLERTIEPIKGQAEDPSDLLDALIESSDGQSIGTSLKAFKASSEWNKALEKYNKNKEDTEARNKVIILKSNASEDILAKLFLNQLDSQGVFYFDPHSKISDPENTDLAFVIKMDDLLTLKINREILENGELHRILISKRHLSLTENFSDRLLNIMGNYFSKIGTDDVMAGAVLGLYTKVYGDSFFLSDSQYDTFLKSKEQKKAQA